MDSDIKQSPKLTVLLPVYNCAKYVGAAIDSVLMQTFKDFEFIIIDDASTDDTLKIINTYSDARIKVIKQQNNYGITHNLNYGLTIAQGEYIARMDGDDISLPKRFEKQITYLDANPNVIVCGTNYKILDTDIIKNLPSSHDDIKVELLYGSCFGHPTVMMRRSVFQENKIAYNTTLETAQDYNLWVRLLQYGELHNLTEVLLEYRIHEDQISKKRKVSQQIGGVKTKFLLLNYLKPNLDEKEQHLLEKILLSIKLEKEILEFNEINTFVTKTKQKLIKANSIRFFNSVGFNKYLNYLEHIIINDYFSYRENFKPIIFLNYLKVKRRFNFKLSFYNEIKLLTKSLVYFKK
ncbi:glycosyltransferase [uncultured Winogradskyella sp.]|uniref:glycosyltransferase family 2 protein n=2 Tax=Winogradskyella TaxID=286104 RepID=UPI00260ABA7F|nr:glycosyltransferase [uncultured Winogradskyella sp.]